ncbi:MAG TPA: hypothetical protein VMW27_29680 [Thermoanaerobaculia bacterium]|nr:hypothetical protein [Thermoanaerobaculia bacterium]
MILLTKAEDLILVQFAEAKGERVGAKPGDTLPVDYFKKLEKITQGVEFEGVIDTVLARNLLKQDGENYVLTQEGYDYLYTPEGRRINEE